MKKIAVLVLLAMSFLLSKTIGNSVFSIISLVFHFLISTFGFCLFYYLDWRRCYEPDRFQSVDRKFLWLIISFAIVMIAGFIVGGHLPLLEDKPSLFFNSGFPSGVLGSLLGIITGVLTSNFLKGRVINNWFIIKLDR
jgi:uncharacterized membrane protein YesL